MGVKGLKATIARLRKLSGPEFEKTIGSALFKTGHKIQTDAQISITDDGSKHGKFAKRGTIRTNFTRSAPGEPPAYDTQEVANSIETVQVEPLKVEVSANDRKSAWLEYGTSKMAARPFMAPAVLRNRDELQKNITAAVRSAIRKSRS